jgi:hypothetical protein
MIDVGILSKPDPLWMNKKSPVFLGCLKLIYALKQTRDDFLL